MLRSEHSMNGLLSEPKNIVIVCDEKTIEYADFLLQLMKNKEDKLENVSGAIWKEKNFTDTEHTISNEQYKLFLGNFKLAKRKRKHIKMSYSKYGIKYGWLGTDAFLFVEDEPLAPDDYQAFIEESKKYGDLLEYNSITLVDEQIVDKLEGENKKEVKVKDEKSFFGSLFEKGKNIDIGTITSQVDSLPKDLTISSLKTSLKIINAAKIRFNKKEIINQQYSFAIVQFYSEGLKQFLEL